ncbi:MAG TPA: hypothetical protein EYP17_00940 [Candidatus Latescibacteria bacterium]|nr:hypothetical protein [Candidatus Latescibacterota bacterium]
MCTLRKAGEVLPIRALSSCSFPRRITTRYPIGRRTYWWPAGAAIAGLRVQLIERLAPGIRRELTASLRRKSLRGLWRDLDISEDDIAQVRREMWGNFPY